MRKLITIIINSILCLFMITACQRKSVVANAELQIQESQQNSPIEIENEDLKYDKYLLDFHCILQNPELPTGCEVTSLAMVLNYLGYDIDKCVLADNFLEKGEIDQTDFSQAFVGNPRDKNGYGCYAPVIEKCAETYLKTVSGNTKVFNLTDKSFETLLLYVQNGIPVITWTTIDLLEPYGSTEWNIQNHHIEWLANEHCVVLTGYDIIENIIYVSDPLKGNIVYDFDLFKQRYQQMYSQAIILIS